MSLFSNAIRRGTRSAQPAATIVVVGTLYFVTDEHALERSTGSAWEAVGPATYAQTITTTGNQTALSTTARTVICNNATLLTVQGLVAGVHGERRTFLSVGAGQVDFETAVAGASAANRIYTGLTTGRKRSLAATCGTHTLVYDATVPGWRTESHEQGDFITVAHAGGNFTADSGTWTVDLADQGLFRYYLAGKRLKVEVILEATAVSATPAGLHIAIPGGHTASALHRAPYNYLEGSTPGVGTVGPSAPAATLIDVYKDYAATAWATAALALGISIEFGIQ